MRAFDPYTLKHFKQMTIHQKILIMVLTIVMLVMSIITVLKIGASVQTTNKDFRLKMTTTTNLAALAFSNSLWNYDDAGIKKIGDALFEDREVGYVSLSTAAGKVIYQKAKSEAAYDHKYINPCEMPVYYGTEKIGEVSVGMSIFYRKASLNNDIMMMVGGIVTALGILWFLISWAVKFVTRPIVELEAGTEDIARGELSKRINIDSGDEIGRLAGKFNIMAESLDAMLKERDAILAALRVSEEKFAKSFHYSAEIIGIIRFEDKSYLEVNDIFFETFGYSREEVIGHTSGEIGLWVSSEEYVNVYQILTSEGAFRNLEMHWRSKSGERYVGLCSGSLVEIGGVSCIIYVWHDITDRKRAEEAVILARDSLELRVAERTEELNQINQELRSTNEELSATLEQLKNTQEHLVQSEKMAALGSLVAGVAHEINTPIGVGLTAASYMEKLNREFREEYESKTVKRVVFEEYLEKTGETANMILLNLERAAKLINSFKQVSIDQSNEARRVFNISKYLDELLASLHPRLKQVKPAVRVECDSSLEIDSYPGAFAQIVTNFIMNALLHAYGPEDEGEMLIRVSLDSGKLRLIFSDDGSGMEKEVLDRIFEPFFTTKRGASGGTGLGLHIVYNIVTQQFGGTIECVSAPMRGTTFIVKFPV